MLVDSHCHLDHPDFDGRMDEIQANMAANGVTHALCISTTIKGFAKVRSLAEEHANLFASVGIHPDTQDEEIDVEELAALADHPRVLALGETGLDYFRAKGDLECQRERFRRHIRAARKAGKPLVVHTREAAEDTLRILEEEGATQAGGVLHCFTETRGVARRALELGFYISFSGIVTFKNAVALKEVARQIPAERLLVETDAPYLAPVPCRGKTNQPAWVRFVAEELARLRGVPLESIARSTTENFIRLFRQTI